MKTCYINVSPKQVRDSLQQAAERKPDSILVVAPVGAFDLFSPTKKEPYHRIKAELILPEDAIIGQECLTDFGLIATLRIPKDRINPKYLKYAEVEMKE